MKKFLTYLESTIKKTFLAASVAAKSTITFLKPTNKYVKTAGLMALTVYISVAINAYYRPIQEAIHNGVVWAYDKNETLGDIVYETNGFLLNGKDFDRERSAKRVIYTAYSQVVMVNVLPKDYNDPSARGMAGRGTGWFYKVDGDDAYIVTNHHVIDSAIKNADTVELKVATAMDMWDYDAEIVGVDEIADIAVIKISKKDNEEWETLEIEDHSEIGVGDVVAVMGHGMGQAYTATQGTVTYKDRYGSRPYNLMLQVDAVINQGNSGGPIINMDGKVVGVAQSILSPARQVPGWDGIGLAVNAETTKRSIEYIMSPQYGATGYVPYAEIPFSMGSVELADVIDIPKDERHHTIIDYTGQTEESTKTVGEIAGLQQGDVLIQIDDKDIRSSFAVLRKIMYAFPGDEWEVTVLRDGKEITVTIALREMDREKLLSAALRSSGGR